MRRAIFHAFALALLAYAAALALSGANLSALAGGLAR